MSKMPAKKRSCFQITSVTVTAAGAADDSESQDDPDDSRTEDVSRAACDSSSEEALNNVGELEADSVVPPSSVPHAGQESAPSSKPSVELRKVGVSGSSQGGRQASGIDAASASQAGPVQQPASSVGVLVNAAQPAAVNNSALPLLATCSVSCISRFKVIRLDHCTTGEPFRRGRWKCAECYVKDSESSVVGQTVESMRHASTTLDPAADSDSGLGLTGGLMVSSAAHSSHGLGSMAHASLSSTHVETHLPQQQQIHHQNYSTRQKGVSGATDDSESLDDLDESRTEEVSPKIYNMSRAVCNSSSEEALNNVGEPEAVSVMQPSSVPHAGQESALSSKPSVELRKVGVSGLSRGGQQASGIDIASGLQTGPVQHQRQQPASPANVLVNTAQPAAVTVSAPLPPTSTVSCVSRFKVIRLDDGTTAQPFRRGRWKCVEFIDKDSESAVVGQTVESMRHASTTLDPAADRDSGLGLTGGSKVSSAAHSSHGLGSMAHASLSSTRIETHLPQQQQIHHQNYSTRQKGVSGAAAADDSESLGDSGESWTEEVLEICDVSEAACDSSAKEALNNVGEPETVSVMPSSSVPHASQQSVLSSNPSVEFQKVGVSGLSQGCQQASGIDVITQAGLVQPASSASVLVNAAQPAAVTTSAPHPATSTVSYISRFKVIKLDDGTTVQPFKKGRRRSTELNEKDPESSVVPPHPSQQQQIHHQNYSAHQKGVSGSATHNSFSNIKPTAVPAQPAVGGLQPLSTQNVLPVEQNSPPQSGVHIQKSPIMPLSAQPSPYPPQQQQVPVSQHLTSQSPGLIQNQTEYYQQHQSASMQPVLASGQSFPVSTQGKGPTSVMPTASRGASVPSQVGDVAGAGGGSVPAGQPAPAVLQQQAIGMGGSVLVGESSMKQQTVNQYASAGQSEPHGHPTFSGVQNVPAITVSSSVPPTVPTAVPSASSAAMPNVTTPSLPPGQTPHSKTIVVLGAQGLPVTGFGQVEVGGGRKSEGPVNAQSPVVSTKEPAKPFMPESLQLTTPTVNSPVDGEEDSASGTNVVAIDNKIEQAMDLVKSHLMYAVREEVEVLKVQIKELHERNSVLERENAMLKSLANSEQLSQLSAQSAASSSASPSQQRRSQPQHQAQPPLQVQPQSHPQLQHHPKPQQLQTQPQLDPVQKLQTNVTSA